MAPGHTVLQLGLVDSGDSHQVFLQAALQNLSAVHGNGNAGGNARFRVRDGHQLVMATDLTANASDYGELPVLLDTVEETFDAQPATVLADAGCWPTRGTATSGT